MSETDKVVTCAFDEPPDEVFFAYMRPGQSQPVVDPGSLSPRTRIEAIDPGGLTYRCVVPTAGMQPGSVISWRMWGESDGEVIDSQQGTITVDSALVPARDKAREIVGRLWSIDERLKKIEYDSQHMDQLQRPWMEVLGGGAKSGTLWLAVGAALGLASAAVLFALAFMSKRKS